MLDILLGVLGYFFFIVVLAGSFFIISCCCGLLYGAVLIAYDQEPKKNSRYNIVMKAMSQKVEETPPPQLQELHFENQV